MSAPRVTPEGPKKKSDWKRLFIRAAGFGAGAALTLVILSGLGIWYLNRPKPPKPWDAEAIKGAYYQVKRVQENKDWRLDFQFVLENTTNKDYELQKSSPFRIAGKLEDTNSLTGFAENYQIVLELPVFIPAHQKTRIDIVLPDYGVNVPEPSNGSTEELHKHRKAVERAVAQRIPNLNGFMIFDENSRYQIDLRSGWKDRKD